MNRLYTVFSTVKKTCVMFCLLAFVLVFIFIIIALFLPEPEDKVLKSLGEYRNHVYYSEGDFQDYTDYAKYYYELVNFTDNTYFNQINESDLNKINEHLDDFELWIETYKKNDASCEIVINYDFDRTIIDKEDYIYIESENFTTTWDDGTSTTTLANYDIYFFDTQTMILYYFHNNI